jgi:hypothetical protein
MSPPVAWGVRSQPQLNLAEGAAGRDGEPGRSHRTPGHRAAAHRRRAEDPIRFSASRSSADAVAWPRPGGEAPGRTLLLMQLPPVAPHRRTRRNRMSVAASGASRSILLDPFPGRHDTPLGQERHQVGGGEHPGCSHRGMSMLTAVIIPQRTRHPTRRAASGFSASAPTWV